MTSQSDDAIRDDAPITASKRIEPALSLTAEAVTINLPAEELYHFWRDPSNLVGVIEDITAIKRIDEARSRWTVKTPAGTEVTWETIITEDIPGESITWQSAAGSDVTHNGRIEFRETSRRGTVVRATIAYDPPAGGIGKLVAKLFRREPRIQARRDLHRFKQLMEAGEIATGARNRRIVTEREGD